MLRAPSFAPNFVKIFWHNHIIIELSDIIIKKLSELNKSEICTPTLCLSREVTKNKAGTIPLRDFPSFILCYFQKRMQT